MNKTIKTIINRIAARNLDDSFIFDPTDHKTITIRQFYRDVLYTSKQLDEFRLPQNIGLVMDNSYRLMLLYFGCLLTGRVAIPIDPKLGQDTIKTALSQFNKLSVIADNDINQFMPNHISLEEVFINAKYTYDEREFISRLYDIDYEQLFLITFTSGTSGVLKGVKNSAANFFLCAEAFIKLHNISPKQIFIHNMVMPYMAGIFNTIFIPFIAGAKIVICPRFSIAFAANFWQLVQEYQADSFWFSPTMLAILLKVDRGEDGINYCQSQPTNWYIATGPLSDHLKTEFENKYPVRLFQSYGLSETLIISSVEANSHALLPKPGSGKLLEGVTLLNDDDGQILLSVPWMFLGYTNAKTSEYFQDDLYKSGDIGLIENDVLYINDRKKDLIIRGGINISPKFVETAIEEITEIEEAAVVGVADHLMGEIICCIAIIKTDDNILLIKKAIMDKVKKLGYGYAIDKLQFANQIPRNLNGKIDKEQIRKMF